VIFEVLKYLPYVVGALVVLFLLFMFLESLYQRTVLGKSKEEILKEEHENFVTIQNEKIGKQSEIQKKKVLDMFLKLTDEDFEKLPFELASITQGESIDRFGLGILEVISISGDAIELRKKLKNKT
tara:strand:- start:175 stop:552 length:378 start_codon:yes stop_codon:yes gene_type:complete